MNKILEYARQHLLAILIGLMVVSLGMAVYFYNEAATLKDDPSKATKKETETLVAQVSKLIVLPEGETPTVATVSDLDKLREQPFFAKAKKGDKVLIYANAKKAFLYDAENNKIVEVAPINIGDK